ncbi:MAG: hypothetical protein ACYSX0_15150 [Planctomycetota bacterium]|jgi:hypothetical protein
MNTTAIACLACALALTPFALIGAMISGGAGHGDYLWAKVFFPYSMLTIHAHGCIETPAIVMAVAQLPLYGLFLAWNAKWRPARLRKMAILLTALHAVAVLLCFVIPIPDFP